MHEIDKNIVFFVKFINDYQKNIAVDGNLKLAGVYGHGGYNRFLW